jgi:hypothetical protein
MNKDLLFTRIIKLKSESKDDHIISDTVAFRNITNIRANASVETKVTSLIPKTYSRNKQNRGNHHNANIQSFKSFTLGGIGPQIHSEEYKAAMKRKQLMNFFANCTKKMNAKKK